MDENKELMTEEVAENQEIVEEESGKGLTVAIGSILAVAVGAGAFILRKKWKKRKLDDDFYDDDFYDDEVVDEEVLEGTVEETDEKGTK